MGANRQCRDSCGTSRAHRRGGWSGRHCDDIVCVRFAQQTAVQPAACAHFISSAVSPTSIHPVRGNSRAASATPDGDRAPACPLGIPGADNAAEQRRPAEMRQPRCAISRPALLLTTRAASRPVATPAACRPRPGSGVSTLEMDARKSRRRSSAASSQPLAEHAAGNSRAASRARARGPPRSSTAAAPSPRRVVVALDDRAPSCRPAYCPSRTAPRAGASRRRQTRRHRSRVALTSHGRHTLAQPPRRSARPCRRRPLAVDLHHRRHEGGGAGDEGLLPSWPRPA